MIQLIQLVGNLIVVTAVGGAAIAVALVVVKVVVSLVALGSSKVDSTVVSKKACAYCGSVLGDKNKCEHCGAMKQRE